MRGADQIQHPLFRYVSQEERIPPDHPLRAIRKLVDASLRGLSGGFAKLYSDTGRPSIAPEQLLRALLLQVLYTVRSERQLMEQLNYNLLFRWFVGLSMDDPIWDATVFTKNRDRLLAGDIAEQFFQQIVTHAHRENLLSDDHFTVDGTLLEAWASHKSFRAKDAIKEKDGPGGADDTSNPSVDFHGQKRSNDTHQSVTDPDARLTRKGPGKEARLCYHGHVLMDNRHGLAANTALTIATGTAEREAALDMLATKTIRKGSTVGGDKNYDTHDFVAKARAMHITPHVAQRTRGSAIDERTTRHEGYSVSQRRRKRIEEIFGWIKTVGNMRKLRHRGREIVDWKFTFTVAVYNVVRIVNLEKALSEM